MKKAFALLMTAVFAISLAACGGHTSTSSEPAANTVAVTDIDGNEIKSGTAAINFGEKTVDISAAYLIDGVDVEITSGVYACESGSSDQVVFLVINGGNLSIKGASDNYVSIKKTGTAAAGGQVGDEYNFFGINSGVVVSGGASSATIDYAEIKTEANGSNAVISTNEASVSVKNSRITTTGEAGSRGLHATYGGIITADSSVITTSGASSAAIATDRGGGVISASQMALDTSGAGSPLIYSTGNITVSHSNGMANNSQMVVVEGGSSAKTIACNFACSGAGNRSGKSESNADTHVVDSAGIFIYQSFSGDAAAGTDYFSAYDCSFEVTEIGVPMFFITNITAEITLNNNTFTSADDADKLFVAEETDQWGEKGKNGGKATVSLTKQDVSGYTAFAGSASSSLTFTATDESPATVNLSTGTWE